MKKALVSALLTGGLITLSATANADTVMLTGSIDGSEPTFDQPLSTASTLVGYDTYEFTVDADGMYSFLSFYAGDMGATENLDGVLLLYAGGFDPTDPVANLTMDNDDYFPGDEGGLSGLDAACNGSNCSGFGATLAAGATYILVQTSFTDVANSFGQPTGSYDLTSTGPGNIDGLGARVVPLPAAVWLLASGLLGLGALRRR